MSSSSATLADLEDSTKRQVEVIDLEAETDHRPRKKMMLDFEKPLDITVPSTSDEPLRRFMAPANIAKARSTFIRQQCEQGRTTVVIKSKRPSLVRAYLHLICTNEVVLASEEKSMSHWQKCAYSVQLYLLAQQMGDPTSANLIIDHMAKLLDSSQIFMIHLVPYVYTRTEIGSALRRVLVDYVAETMSAHRFMSKLVTEWPPEFWYDTAVAMAKLRDSNGLRAENILDGGTSRYHLQS